MRPKSAEVFELSRKYDNDSRDEESFTVAQMTQSALAGRYLREYTAIVPEWAVPVPDNVVITGWER